MLSFSKEAGSAFLHLEIKIGLKKKKKSDSNGAGWHGYIHGCTRLLIRSPCLVSWPGLEESGHSVHAGQLGWSRSRCRGEHCPGTAAGAPQ